MPSNELPTKKRKNTTIRRKSYHALLNAHRFKHAVEAEDLKSAKEALLLFKRAKHRINAETPIIGEEGIHIRMTTHLLRITRADDERAKSKTRAEEINKRGEPHDELLQGRVQRRYPTRREGMLAGKRGELHAGIATQLTQEKSLTIREGHVPDKNVCVQLSAGQITGKNTSEKVSSRNH